MFANSEGLIVQQADSYNSIVNGDQYGSDWDKSTIAELTLVTEVARPTDRTLNITGFTVDGSYNQVWTTVAKNQTELDETLVNLKDAKNLSLKSSHETNSSLDISFTSDDTTVKDYQADTKSIVAIKDKILTYPTTTPVGFYWRSKDNTNVDFIKADLDGLMNAIGDRENTNYQNLQAKKVTVNAISTVGSTTTFDLVDAVEW